MYKVLSFLILYQTFLVKGENKLMATMVENFMDCMSQAPENFSLDVCQEMVREGNDNTQAKYDSCKCLGACTSKKLGIMDENGAGVRSKFEEYITQLDNETWQKEAKHILDKCSNTPGKNCELSYNFMVCTMQNSQMVRDFVKAMTGGNKEDEK
ncbi:uncharacterized protein LOC135838132 [Planococcus citri]|uniref:uncharacterized protein LOC135838132 n=1 Tax=Planococcus citri TaxID=170843 RepID=UPI0031FA3F05